MTAAELFARRQLKLTEKKEAIAEVALLIVENPEEHVCLMSDFWDATFMLSCYSASLKIMILCVLFSNAANSYTQYTNTHTHTCNNIGLPS